MSGRKIYDFKKLREKLKPMKGTSFWRNLEELAETDEFKKFLGEEFPYGAMNEDHSMSRRSFLKVMGASLLLSGLAGCRPQPQEKIVPYRKAPENMIPGKPLFFATAMTWNGFATGLIAESHMGRPTRLDGNPEHPDSLGASNPIHQAAVLGLYDPDRSKAVLRKGQISTWGSFTSGLAAALRGQERVAGAGLRILTESVTSPLLAYQIEEVLKKYPEAEWVIYDPLHRDNARLAQQEVFGEFLDPLYDFEKADVILSVDSNFLFELPGSLRYTRQFSSRRKPGKENKMNRLYQIEATVSLAGAKADHRLVLNQDKTEAAVSYLAAQLGISHPVKDLKSLSAEDRHWLDALKRDLEKNRGTSLIVAGNAQPPQVQALVYALNDKLGNTGKTVRYIEPVEARPGIRDESVHKLVKDMAAGKVDLLLMLGGNPVYNMPADLGFEQALAKVDESIHLSLYQDETSLRSRWHLPQTHFLEMFSDARASDGTVSTIQPLIEPLYQGKSVHEITALFENRPEKKGHDILKNYWKGKLPGLDFEKSWRKALHDGLVANTARAGKNPKTAGQFSQASWEKLSQKGSGGKIDLIFRPDPSIWDGAFSNNAWLQELPKPFTKLTWDNPALISPAMAEKNKLANGDEIEITFSGKSMKLPVWITPGHADNAITLNLGYGRRFEAQVAGNQGFNTYLLRTASTPWFASAESFRKTGKHHELATTQHHHSMEGRHLVRTATLDEYLHDPEFAHKLEHHDGPLPSIYPGFKYDGYAWGMTIDLNACIGCNSCVAACQSENNIAVVGKEEVLRGREMHWIRIDNYYEGGLDNPKTHQQPVACMHCENAPCEPVCPVGATVHSSEGLNEMVYNRCVGTRYCSNNCPYKVRRFNFLEYQDRHTEVLKLGRNPDVTVRSRGVMEKCTFCVQRISEARINAKKEGRTIEDGEVVTACQTACPAQAIVFGDINNKNSKVHESKKSPLNYGLLTELNTSPRLTYLAKVTNPNPELAGKEVAHHG